MKAVPLGELEKKIMDILWKYKECSTRDVLRILEREKRLAYTTVATILQRLYDKDLLTRRENKARNIYCPKVSKKKYSMNLAQSFLKKFIDSFGNTAIASFADSIDKLPTKKREFFLKLLEEHDKNK